MLTTWNKTILRERGEIYAFNYKTSGDDSCIVAIKWHNGLVCLLSGVTVVGKSSLLSPT